MAAIPAMAQTVREPDTVLLNDAIWLGSSDRMADLLTSQPPEYLRSVAQGGQPSFLVRLGKLAFRSPFVVGGRAGRLGLSCNTCHPNGGANVDFFVEGLSDRPGSVDASHAFWNRRADDGFFNPVNVPSLRGVRLTAPYGRDGRFASLAEFTRHVIVTEFGGDEPEPLILDALVAYQLDLALLPNPLVDSGGQLAAAALPLARAAAGLFARDCGGCHGPDGGFVDGRRHDVGTDGHFDTPVLLGLAESAPYFHDGRAADLAAVVDHFDEVWSLGYDLDERRAMIAYLEAVGAVGRRRELVTLSATVAALQDFTALVRELLESEDAALVDLVVDMVRLEIGRLHQRFPAPEHGAARETIAGWAHALRRVARLAEQGAFPAARTALVGWHVDVADSWPSLEAVARTSLFNPRAIPHGG